MPGDGIGREVIAAAVGVLDAVTLRYGCDFDLAYSDIGAERYLRTGELLTDGDLDDMRRSDAVLFGAIGDPRVAPGILEKGVLLRMRTSMDQYINLRPVRSWHPYVPLKRETDFDIRFLRENTEDFYMGAGGRFGGSRGGASSLSVDRSLYSLRMELRAEGCEDDFAYEIGLLSRKGVERFADYAFRYAASRGEDGITLVDKANVIGMYGMQREVFAEKAEEQGMRLDLMYADAMAMAMVSRPETFGTVAVPNLFGDVLTDLGAQLQGGLGLGASGDICPGGVSMFEPIHGSAPDIAGKSIVNPTGAVLALSMLLENLGFAEEAEAVGSAVRACLSEGSVTPDLGGTLSTAAAGKRMGELVLTRR